MVRVRVVKTFPQVQRQKNTVRVPPLLQKVHDARLQVATLECSMHLLRHQALDPYLAAGVQKALPR